MNPEEASSNLNRPNQDNQHSDQYMDHGLLREQNHSKYYTAIVLVSYISLYSAIGGILGILGPALPSLSTQINARRPGETHGVGFGRMGFTFTGRAGGWLIGSVLGGIALDQVTHSNMGNKLVALLIFVAGITTSLIPFCTNLFELVLVLFLQGIVSGAGEAMVNTLVVWRFDRKATTPLQAVHFGFGCGALITPLLVAVALKISGLIYLSFWLLGIYCVMVAILPLFLQTPQPTVPSELRKTPQLITETPQFPTYTRFEDPNSEMKERSLDSGVFLDTLAEPTENEKSGLVYRERFNSIPNQESHASVDHPNENDQNVSSEEQTTEPLISSSRGNLPEYGITVIPPESPEHSQQTLVRPRSFRLSESLYRNVSLRSIRSYFRHVKKRITLGSVLISMDVLFLFLIIGFEVAFGGWISAYALSLQIMSEQEAATLSSVFWAALTLGRLIGVPLSAILNTIQMLLLDMVSAIFSATFLVIFPQSHLGIWIITAATGLSVASIYPSAIALPGTFGLKVTGRGTSFLIVGACMGEVVIPFVIGPFFEYFGSTSLRWITLIVSLLSLCSLVVLWLIGREILRSCNIGTIAKDLNQPETKRG
eukprot:gb/GECH01008361.1/.p1 GENE.gb/GECH01008361.1/~~gb/GECH01008361.1/.p1  ORF type:complete len:597 (+),score=84.58 gb/GECH01008361.1/:1-1791(+)